MILSNNAEILQILEIPQFMNTCIRSELYEEALLLTSFVKRLSSQHGDIPLIAVSIYHSLAELENEIIICVYSVRRLLKMLIKVGGN